VSTNHDATLFEVPGAGREVLRLIRQLQALTLELDALRKRATSQRELQAKERTLEQLRWRLAAAARHAATGDLGSAA